MVKSLLTKSTNWLHKEHQSILSAAAIISASYTASALLGVVRNRLLAGRFFGTAAADLDVYFAAFVIPDTLFQLIIVGALSAAFVPVYQDYLQRSSEDANRMANAALTNFVFILLALNLGLVIFANPIANATTHFLPAQTEKMANLMRIMSLAQMFFAVSAFLTGVLQSQRRFLVPAVAPVFYNLGSILGIFFLSPYIGIYSAAVGIVIGAFLHLIIQLPLARTVGFVPHLVISPLHPGSTSILKLMPPRSAALGISQFERYIAVNLISPLIIGSLTIFSLARQLYLLPVSLFGVALGQASFPSLSEEASRDDLDRFRQTLSKSLLQVFFFSLPASVLLLVLRIPLVRIAFGADNFPWSATLLTGKALAVLAITIAPQAATHVLVRAFYAKKDTRTPLIVSSISILIFIGLGYLFTRVYPFGVLGISLALSVGNFIDFVLLYYLISRKAGRLYLTMQFVKMVVASFFTALFLWGPMRLLDQFVFDTTHTLPLVALTVIVTLIGGLVYLSISAFLKVQEFYEMMGIIERQGNWRQILIRSDEVIESPSE